MPLARRSPALHSLAHMRLLQADSFLLVGLMLESLVSCHLRDNVFQLYSVISSVSVIDNVFNGIVMYFAKLHTNSRRRFGSCYNTQTRFV